MNSGKKRLVVSSENCEWAILFICLLLTLGGVVAVAVGAVRCFDLILSLIAKFKYFTIRVCMLFGYN